MKHYGFNMKNKPMIDMIEANERFELNLYRNKVLLTGDAAVVEKFYKVDYGKMYQGTSGEQYDMSSHTGTFWYNVGPKNARVLFGITKMINDAFVRLITSGGVDFKVYKDEENEDEDATKRLDDILTYNNFYDNKWGKAESMQSGLGYTAFKWSIDTEDFDKPIVEVVSSENIEVITKRDFIIGYKFKKYRVVNDKSYEVQEIYRKENNKPIIEYRVIDIALGQEIPFSAVPNMVLRELGLDFLDKENPIVDVFGNMEEIPVILKNNTAYNSFFPNCPFGEPDTQGLDLIEDALSEMISAMVEEIRKGRIKVLISEELVPRDTNGKATAFDDFKLDYEIINKHEAEGKNLIEIIQGEINSEKYLKGIASLIMYACNKANLHPITVGVTGVESIMASQESQVEREKVSMRTREMKLESWRENLIKLGKHALQLDDVMNNRPIGEYDVVVEFGSFTNPNRESIVDLLGKAVTSGILSIQEAQREYYGDNLSEDEKLEVYIKTKVEKGIPLTTPERDLYERVSEEETGIQATPTEIIE
jgi:hypothetical protein